MIDEKLNWDEMPALRARARYLSQIWGTTVFPMHISHGYAKLYVQRMGKTRYPLVSSAKVSTIRAIVEWEIAKAEGTLRIAA